MLMTCNRIINEEERKEFCKTIAETMEHTLCGCNGKAYAWLVKTGFAKDWTVFERTNRIVPVEKLVLLFNEA